ncbi:hypothetical protein M0R45_003650 [Rubus argutus]|uniref:Uncharacterized protein n=1 Tax=Rubus argutus TaxID=59490 RepID=A0AAW1YFS2_RUBAR
MGRKPCCEKKGSTEDHGRLWKIRSSPTTFEQMEKEDGEIFLEKLGNISADEEELIIRLHKLLGNRWSLIAGRLPGRTDNEIKNYWNTYLSKRSCSSQQNDNTEGSNEQECAMKSKVPVSLEFKKQVEVIRTKAVKCKKALVNPAGSEFCTESPCSTAAQEKNNCDFLMDFNINDLLISDAMLESTTALQQPQVDECHEDQMVYDGGNDLEVFLMDKAWSENWRASTHDYPIQPNDIDGEDVDLNALSSFLNSADYDHMDHYSRGMG